MALPAGFVYLKDVDPTIIQDMKYYSDDNFIGRPIKGYRSGQCILTKEAATALAGVQKKLKNQSMSLKVFDCYRPQMAVNDFIVWSQDQQDQKMKQQFYPRVNKADFFELGYVAKQSSHTRGSTTDLTIVRIPQQGEPIELEMGTHFDFMDELSHSLSPNIQGQARQNRLLLRSLMEEAGFEPYAQEWWHFTFKKEPFLSTYFNFEVE